MDSTHLQIRPACLDIDKRKFRKPKNRKPLIERSVRHRSIMTIRSYLQNFCWQFLRYCYNPLMRTVRASLTRQAIQENDETYYLWAMRFFMAFCRYHKFRPAYLSETLNTSTFHWIYDQIMNYREVLLSDKRGGGTNARAVQSSRRLELSISAFREFLSCLTRMLKVNQSDRLPDAALGETVEAVEEQIRIQASAAESIMSNIFYVSEYQEVYPILLKDYNEAVQSREYLQSLVEGAHLFVSLLTDRLQGGSRKLVVRRIKKVERRKHRKSRSSQRPNAGEEESPELRTLRLNYQWQHLLAPALIAALSHSPEATNDTEESVDFDQSRLFDAASTGSEEMQMQSAIRHVQAALFAGQALSGLRLARLLWRLWPEITPITVEDDDPVRQDDRAAVLDPNSLAILSALRQIHMTEFEDASHNEDDDSASDSESADSEYAMLYDEEMASHDMEGELMTVEKEVQVDLNSFMYGFAHPKIIHCFTLLLADYAINPRSTNTSLIHLIHRLAVRQKLLGCFFQLRLFHVFHLFLHDRAVARLDEFKELTNLIKYIMRKFFETLDRNNAVLIELLFFKTVKEGHEVFKGYGTVENEKSNKWTPAMDEELSKLFEAYRNDPVPKGSDLGDVLVKHFSDETKTRRQIISRLITLGMIFSAKELKQITIRDKESGCSNRTHQKDRIAAQEWTENEIIRLRSAVNAHAGSNTLLSDIMTDLSTERQLALEMEDNQNTLPVRSRQAIARKLLELRLVPDKSTLGRPVRKSNPGGPKRRRSGTVDLDASISVFKRNKRPRRKRVLDSDSEEELRFDSEDQDTGLDDEIDQRDPSDVTDLSQSDHGSIARGLVTPEDSPIKQKRSRMRLNINDSDSGSDLPLTIDESPIVKLPDQFIVQESVSGKRSLFLVSSDEDECNGIPTSTSAGVGTLSFSQ